MWSRATWRSFLRGRLFWALVLVVIGVDLWWTGTPSTFEWWWVPLFVLNAVCLALVLWPVIRGKP